MNKEAIPAGYPTGYFDTFLAWRPHPDGDGKIIAIDPLTFGRARINVYDGYSVLDGW